MGLRGPSLSSVALFAIGHSLSARRAVVMRHARGAAVRIRSGRVGASESFILVNDGDWGGAH